MKKIIFIILTLLWMIVIFSFSAKTASDSTVESMFITTRLIKLFINNPPQNLLDITETVVRKTAHFTEYAILGILMYNLFRSFNVSAKKSFFAVAVCFLYAVSDEIHQYFVPGRACRFLDMLIDTAGSAFGSALSILTGKICSKKG